MEKWLIVLLGVTACGGGAFSSAGEALPDMSIEEGGHPVKPCMIPEGGKEAEAEPSPPPMYDAGTQEEAEVGETGTEAASGPQAYCCVTLGSGDTCDCAPYGTATCASMACQPIPGETLSAGTYEEPCSTVVTWASPGGGAPREATCAGVTEGSGGGGV